MMLTRRHYLLTGGAVLFAVGLGIAAATLANHRKPIVIPESTVIHVTLDQALASNQSRPGDHFAATVSEPIIIDEKSVIPQGTSAEGVVEDARPSGRLMGRAQLQLALESVSVNGENYGVRTYFFWKKGGDHKKRNWAWIGGGAGGGALIGALAGGGKGALIGGPIGAGAGTTVAFLTGRKDIYLRPETQLTFKLSEPVTIYVKG